MQPRVSLSLLPLLIGSWLNGVSPAMAYLVSPVGQHSYPAAEQTPLVFNQKNFAEQFQGQGRPKRRSSGGARSTCQSQLIALLPGQGQGEAGPCGNPSTSFLARTTEASPTLWFYIPMQAEATVAELVFLDQQRRPIASQTLPLNLQESSIIGIPIEHQLEFDRVYDWVFSISDTVEQPLAVEGQIQRVTPSAALTQQLQNTHQPRQQIALFAAHGFWHNALTALIQDRQGENPPSTSSDWNSFMESVGLGEISTAPIQL